MLFLSSALSWLLGSRIAIMGLVALSLFVGGYVKGRLDCKYSDLVKAKDAMIEIQEEIIDRLQKKVDEAQKLTDEHEKKEADNEVALPEIVGNPTPADGCIDPGFMRRLGQSLTQ